jgi:hypothetical protein
MLVERIEGCMPSLKLSRSYIVVDFINEKSVFVYRPETERLQHAGIQ